MTLARTLNEDRRQLTREQRLPVVKALREEGHSTRAIGRALGVGQTTVRRDVEELRQTAQLEKPERITGLDGKSRPAQRPTEKAATQTSHHRSPRGHRKDKKAARAPCLLKVVTPVVGRREKVYRS